MGRGKGALRKESSDPLMVTRRPLMDTLPSPPPPKRPRHSSQNASNPVHLPRFLYSPGRYLDIDRLLTPSTPSPLYIEVYIPGEYLTASHPPLQARQLWGSGPYTDDSDLVAVVVHSGKYVLPSTRHHGVDFLRVLLRVARFAPRRPFSSTEANGVKSRYWGDAFQGAILDIEEVEEEYEEGGHIVRGRPARSRMLATVRPVVGLAQTVKEEKKQMLGGIVVMYDLSNEPCMGYSPRLVCTIDIKLPSRMEKEVLYLENKSHRYEVAKVGSGLRFAKVKHHVLEKITVASIGLDVNDDVQPPCSFPVKEIDIELIADNVKWDEFIWDADGFTFRKCHYHVTKCFFRKMNQPTSPH